MGESKGYRQWFEKCLKMEDGFTLTLTRLLFLFIYLFIYLFIFFFIYLFFF